MGGRQFGGPIRKLRRNRGVSFSQLFRPSEVVDLPLGASLPSPTPMAIPSLLDRIFSPHQHHPSGLGEVWDDGGFEGIVRLVMKAWDRYTSSSLGHMTEECTGLGYAPVIFAIYHSELTDCAILQLSQDSKKDQSTVSYFFGRRVLCTRNTDWGMFSVSTEHLAYLINLSFLGEVVPILPSPYHLPLVHEARYLPQA